MSKKNKSKSLSNALQHDTIYLKLLSYYPIAIEGKHYLCKGDSFHREALASALRQVGAWSSKARFCTAFSIQATDMVPLNREAFNRIHYSLNKLQSWAKHPDAGSIFPGEWTSKGQFEQSTIPAYQQQLQLLKQWQASGINREKPPIQCYIPEGIAGKHCLESLPNALINLMGLLGWRSNWSSVGHYLKTICGIEELIASLPAKQSLSQSYRNMAIEFLLSNAIYLHPIKLPEPRHWLSFASWAQKHKIEAYAIECWTENLKELPYSSIAKHKAEASKFLRSFLDQPSTWIGSGRGTYAFRKPHLHWISKGFTLRDTLRTFEIYGEIWADQIPPHFRPPEVLVPWLDMNSMFKRLGLPKKQQESLIQGFRPEHLWEANSKRKGILGSLAKKLCEQEEGFSLMEPGQFYQLMLVLKNCLYMGIDDEGWALLQAWISPKKLPKPHAISLLTQDPTFRQKLRMLAFYRTLLQQPEIPQSILKLLEQEDRLSRQLAYVEQQQDEAPDPLWVERGANIRKQLQKLPRLKEKELRNKLKTALPQAFALSLHQILRRYVVTKIGKIMPFGKKALQTAAFETSYSILSFYQLLEGDEQRLLASLLSAFEEFGEKYKQELPMNQQWAEAIEGQRDISNLMEGWLMRESQTLFIEGKRYQLSETDDLRHLLMMGSYFDTCLSIPLGMNARSTLRNASDINKKLLIVTNNKGKVVGRKLIALSEELELIGYHSYCGLHTHREQIAQAFTNHCRRIAYRSGTGLGNSGKPTTIHPGFWYDDGLEHFEQESSLSPALVIEALALLESDHEAAKISWESDLQLPEVSEKALSDILLLLGRSIRKAQSGSASSFMLEWSIQSIKHHIMLNPSDRAYYLNFLRRLATPSPLSYTKDALWEWAMIMGDEGIPQLRGIGERSNSDEHTTVAINALWSIGSSQALEALAYLFFQCSDHNVEDLISSLSISSTPLQQKLVEEACRQQHYGFHVFSEYAAYFQPETLVAHLPNLLEKTMQASRYERGFPSMFWWWTSLMQKTLQPNKDMYALFKKIGRSKNRTTPYIQQFIDYILPLLGGSTAKEIRKSWQSMQVPDEQITQALAIHCLLFQPIHRRQSFFDELLEEHPLNPSVAFCYLLSLTPDEWEAGERRVRESSDNSLESTLTLAKILYSNEEFGKAAPHSISNIARKLGSEQQDTLYGYLLAYLIFAKAESMQASSQDGRWAPLLSKLSHTQHFLWHYANICPENAKAAFASISCESPERQYLLPHLSKLLSSHEGIQAGQRQEPLKYPAPFLPLVIGIEPSLEMLQEVRALPNLEIQLSLETNNTWIELMEQGCLQNDLCVIQATAQQKELWASPLATEDNDSDRLLLKSPIRRMALQKETGGDPLQILGLTRESDLQE